MYVIVLWLAVLGFAPTALFTAAQLQEIVDARRVSARELATYGVARAMNQLAENDEYSGVELQTYPEGVVAVEVLPGSGVRRTVIAVAYVSTTPAAISRVTATVERDEDPEGEPAPARRAWRLLSRQIIEGPR